MNRRRVHQGQVFILTRRGWRLVMNGYIRTRKGWRKMRPRSGGQRQPAEAFVIEQPLPIIVPTDDPKGGYGGDTGYPEITHHGSADGGRLLRDASQQPETTSRTNQQRFGRYDVLRDGQGG